VRSHNSIRLVVHKRHNPALNTTMVKKNRRDWSVKIPDLRDLIPMEFAVIYLIADFKSTQWAKFPVTLAR
jgi:hypothetical protein